MKAESRTASEIEMRFASARRARFRNADKPLIRVLVDEGRCAGCLHMTRNMIHRTSSVIEFRSGVILPSAQAWKLRCVSDPDEYGLRSQAISPYHDKTSPSAFLDTTKSGGGR